MRRRSFASLIAAATIFPPLAASGQDRVRRVGLLSNGSADRQPGMRTTWQSELLRVLAENGFHRGRNLELVDRYSDGNLDRLAALAREITAARVEVVLAVPAQATRAMRAADATVPLVIVTGDDPVAAGFVASLARPGGQTTGVLFRTLEGDVKRLELLRDVFPRSRRFGFLGYSGSSPRILEAVRRTASQLDVSLSVQMVDQSSGYAPAFDALKKEQVAGVVVEAAQPHAHHVLSLVAAANETSLPTVCQWEFMARAGCFLSYGQDLGHAHRRAGEYVARILRGASPSELPLEQLDAWKLTVNAGVASRLRITIPNSVIARAEEVIE